MSDTTATSTKFERSEYARFEAETYLGLRLQGCTTRVAGPADPCATVGANGNQLAWPVLPFPEGWYAAC
jgi:hypothetical protein